VPSFLGSLLLGTLVTFPLVKTIREHLALMRWLVIVVILYAAVSMLRSAGATICPDPATATSESG